VAKKSILDYAKSIPGYLQSVPERVPFIRDRGLIFFGRTELDFAYYSSGITRDDTGFRLRSLRVGLAKAFEYNLSVKAEIDLTDGDSNFADLYVRYRHKKYGLFTAGNQRVALTLVNQTSRISRTFMEESLPAEAFGLLRRLALGWDLHKPKGGVHVTLFGPDLNGSIGDSGFAGRGYFNPTRSRFSLFHVGASFVVENMDRKTRFFSHPESRVTSVRLVDTGIYGDVSKQKIGALEVAGAKESCFLRGEFFAATWDRKYDKDPVFRGFYVQASWILTGETFKYTQGKFVRVRPQNPRGAWEVAVRFSKVDLNDRGITGGEEKNLTVGVNWYAPGNQFRVMSNLIFVSTDVPLSGEGEKGNESPTIFQLRAQFHW
jgi:phosphate-selective porin OprO/OprP